MKWLHVHIEGQVQGVGFRPFVYKLANWLQLKGWVCNGVDGVHIEAGGDAEQIEMFLYLLHDDAPVESRITNLTTEEITPLDRNDFQIVDSNPLGMPNLLITPDLGLCEVCINDIDSSINRRHQYPFTTCTHCGPRYSIIKSLPYDRQTTAMEKFTMCSSCDQEYHDPYNRRHYSQTNSCPQCAIPLQLTDKSGKILTTDGNQALKQLIDCLQEGNIAAVKAIGGYMLMTDATNPEAIKKLRDRKHRPAKPFALMYPNLAALRKDTHVTTREEEAFQSTQSPVVLVEVKSNPESGICVSEIAPGLSRIGAMRPYTAMFQLLMNEWGKPIIATSGNVSGSSIIYEDHHALEALHEIADLFLINDCEIQISQDDSVVSFSQMHRHLIRRSRGYAPTYLNNALANSSECILALGADLKAAFALQANGRIYISQYLGNLETNESQEFFRHTLDHLLSLLRVRPQKIIIDAHPNYFSSQLGRQLSELWALPYEEVCHHHAHAWSVLAENNLLRTKAPVLCVIWDGSGYGDDKQIWGGEFFVYNTNALERVSHLSYTPVWQDNDMAREPRLSALYMCRDLEQITLLKNKFTETEWEYYHKLIQTKPGVYTSSVGRLFDAVASILNICDYNSFEAEAAMLLEAVATKGVCEERYEVGWVNNNLDPQYLIAQIISDILRGKGASMIAYKFHVFLADVINDFALQQNVKTVALSGDIFQNTLLVDLLENRSEKQYQVKLNRELSSNDENISLGQLAYSSLHPERIEAEHQLAETF